MLFDHFIKGANKSYLIYRNFTSVIKWILLGLIFFFIVMNFILFVARTTPYERYLLLLDLKVHVQIKLQSFTQGKKNAAFYNSTIQWITPKGRKSTIRIKNYLESPYYIQSLIVAKQALYSGLIISAITTLLLLFLIIGFLILKGSREANKKILRGAKVVSARKLNRMLKNKGMKSNIPIGNSYLVKDTDIEHVLLLGSMRQGKSTAIQWLITQSPGKKIIWDITGEFISLFYRADKDYILNPFDKRSQKWNIWAECNNEVDINAISQSLIPIGTGVGEHKFWTVSAQNIFSAVANALMEQGRTKTEVLLQNLFSVDLSQISSLIKGTEAEALVSQKVEKMAISIKSELNSHIKSLKYLDDNTENLFSIKKWMHDETSNDSVLFISADEVQLNTLKPLISVWLDTAVRSLMTLPPSRERRVRFYFDEIASLQYLPSLESGMTRSPKYGGCFTLGAQSISQFEKNYGPVATNILFDACSTKVYFRLPSVKTAKWAASDIGEEELEEKRETMNITANRHHGGSISSNEQIRVRYPVSYTEIKNLEKLTAFLNLPGNWPIAKIKFKIFNKAPIAPAFVPADMKPIKIIPVTMDVDMEENTGDKISQLNLEEMDSW